MKVKRFFYVSSPRSLVRHIMYGKTHSEGAAKCGTFVRKGWRWVMAAEAVGPVCKRCEAA